MGEAVADHRIKAVVIPVYNTPKSPYLTTLVKRSAKPTTMIWGWQGQKAGVRAPRRSKRMSGPRRILEKEQPALPFLFRATHQRTKRVTHVALCLRLWHDDERRGSRVLARWLGATRVERFARKDRPLRETAATSFYVVTGARKLDRPIPYERLNLASGSPLSPRMERGYAIVRLPDDLYPWYQRAIQKSDRVEAKLPK